MLRFKNWQKQKTRWQKCHKKGREGKKCLEWKKWTKDKDRRDYLNIYEWMFLEELIKL